MTAERRSGFWSALRWGHLRLRHKLGLSLAIAALLPVLVATWVAVSIILDGLERGLRDDTDRQLHVGLNLLVRNVERLGLEAVGFSDSGEVRRAVRNGPAQINAAIDRVASHLPAAVLQVADPRGTILVERVVGGAAADYQAAAARPGGASFEAARRFERRVTIVTVSDQLVVRAAAPIVDEEYTLLGAVVLSMPLDGAVADSIRAALGTDVMVFAGDGQRAPASTFLNAQGARITYPRVPLGLAERVAKRESAFGTLDVGEREYAVGYAPVVDLAGDVVGIFAVAVDRAPLTSARRAAARSLALGGAGALLFALGLAGLLSRRITRPLQRLHGGAMAVARGDMHQPMDVDSGDEIGDLAGAFEHMTRALHDNQQRLAARMREIVALHDAGRAVSSVLDLEQVLRTIVDAVARVFGARICALWLVPSETGGDETELELGEARAVFEDDELVRGAEVGDIVAPLRELAAEVARTRATLRIDRVEDDPSLAAALTPTGVTGSLIAVPVERKSSAVGVIVLGADATAPPFTEADANLLATFADQAATAVEHARLYEEVRAFNEELEGKVAQRTDELVAINKQLAATITELRETQTQLIISERLAGVGMLVAGVAHEINSPTAAIRGTVDTLAASAARVMTLSRELAELDLSADERDRFLAMCVAESPRLAVRGIPAPARTRRVARELKARLIDSGVEEVVAAEAAGALADLAPGPELIDRVTEFAVSGGPAGATERARVMVGFLTESAYLHRASDTIGNAVERIQRIVLGLKSYSHLDQELTMSETDIHEGIESTLVLLDHMLARGITVKRNYSELPKIVAHVDELNQVWTNLIHNAVQALDGQGTVNIETRSQDGGIVVAVVDNGPGIPAEVLPHVFEPFFTTKRKGEGTGLGLRIAQQIVERHGGKITLTSRPGETRFEVWLPRVARAATDEAAREGATG